MSSLIKYFNGDDLAASVWQGKYQAEGEELPSDMHRRMAKEFAEVERHYVMMEAMKKFDDENNLKEILSPYALIRPSLTEDRIFNYFDKFKYIIPQGSVMSQLGVNSIGSLSNCFVVGQPVDSYGGIFQKDQQLAQLMKRRGGVGIDISTLRPAGAPTSNAAKSSTGAMSFMHRFSNTTREVAQNGRRGALMISTDINHPDVLDFINIKRDLTQVTGANISIKLNNEFMEAVVKDDEYTLRWPCNVSPEEAEYTKVVSAKEYWYEIIKSAHNVAEPGLMFWNNMVEYSPDGIYEQFRQITTNPCSEIGMQAYDACRLIAVNLFSFVKNPFTEEAEFDYVKFYETNYEAMRLSDDLIDLELKHIKRILEKIEKDPEPPSVKREEYELWVNIYNTAKASRRTGLGFTALGDTLAALGLKYDSDESLKTIEKIMHTKLESELDCTTDLAILRGTFEGWDYNTEFVKMGAVGSNDFYQFICDKFPEQAKKMYIFGRRNVSWSTVAPTGSVSLLAQVTSGIEPLFMPFYIRRKKVNPNDEGVRIDFTDQNGDNWMEYAVLHPKFKDWLILNYTDEDTEGSPEDAPKEMLEVMFKKSPWYGATANDINWVRRVEIQGIIQKYITHSISSTINLPSDVSEEEVSKIYLESWKKGLKGITVYRDGSRSGVMISDSSTNVSDGFSYKDAVKRPKSLPVEVHTTTTQGEKYNIIVGLMDDKPYEVFVTEHFTNIKEGELSKVKKGRYDLLVGDETHSEDITSEMTDEQTAITRLVSTSLRHGTDIKFIVEQLNKADGDLFSFTKSLARVLKKYIPDGAKASVTCNDCGSDNVIFEEGCHKCLDCGSSKCG